MTNENWKMIYGKSLSASLPNSQQALPGSLALRGIVAFPCAHSWLSSHAADLYFDGPVFSVARFVGGIVTQAVLRPYFIGYLRKCRLRILQARGHKVSATACFCQLVHFTPR